MAKILLSANAAWNLANFRGGLIRALVAGCRAEPALNAWYDSEKIGRWGMKKIDSGIAVDTPDPISTTPMRGR